MDTNHSFPNADATIRMSSEEMRLRLRSIPDDHRSRNESWSSNQGVSAESTPNTITIENNEGPNARKTMVTIHQLLDLKEGQQFTEQIKSEAPQGHLELVINLAKLVFCDSITLGFCLIWYTICKQFKVSIVFTMRENSFIHEKFRQSRLLEICNIEFI